MSTHFLVIVVVYNRVTAKMAKKSATVPVFESKDGCIDMWLDDIKRWDLVVDLPPEKRALSTISV